MLELLTEPFAFAFMRNALYAGLATVVASSVIGTWVVLRGMSFMGDALAHGVLPGIAIAYIVGGNLLFGGAISAAVMIGGVTLASSRSRLGDDVAIGLLFVGMLAAGVAIISIGGQYAGDLTTILFGEPLGVRTVDVQVALIGAVVAVLLSALLYRPFLVLSFSADKARALGLRPTLTHLTLLAAIAGVVIVSFRTVGTLLVFALLVAPPATASLLARRVPVMMVVGTAFGALAVVVGLLVSFHLGVAAGPAMAGLSVLGFFVVLAFTEVRRALTRHGQRAAEPA